MFEVHHGNYKSTLTNISALHFGADQPIYVHFDYGQHHAKVFLCICIFQEQTTSSKGRTKIEAEQFASREMLDKIQKCFFKKIERAWVFLPHKEQETFPQKMRDSLGDVVQDSRADVLSLYGDALVRYFIVRYLFDEYAQFPEGVLTRITSEALKEETRARIAQQLSLNQLIPGAETSKKLARILSIVVGKLAFCDSETTAKNLVMEDYKAFIDHAVANILRDHMMGSAVSSAARISTTIHNFKNELQEYTQQRKLALPAYELINKAGPADDLCFTVQCNCAGHETTGTAKKIKAAEQDAACAMLTLVHKRDAASTRIVGTSKSYAHHDARLKRFKAPELNALKRSILWPHFESLDCLQLAFTHPSQNPDDNYQRLEFLGDALLRKILLAYLLKTYPDLSDSAILSPAVDQLVSAETQGQIAIDFDLGRYVFTQADLSLVMLGDVLEALIAAIYLDAETGFDDFDARHKNPDAVISAWFKKNIEHIFKKPAVKSAFFQPPRSIPAKSTFPEPAAVAEASAAAFPALSSARKSPLESKPKRKRQAYAEVVTSFIPARPKKKRKTLLFQPSIISMNFLH